VPFALALSTLVPLLSRCTLPRPLWLTGTGVLFLLAIIAAVMQGLEPSFSIAAPQRLSITYLEDRMHAFWAVDAEAPVPQKMRKVANFFRTPQRIPGIAPSSYLAPAGRAHLAVSTATVVARQLVAARPSWAVQTQNGDGVTLINTVTIPAAQ